MALTERYVSSLAGGSGSGSSEASPFTWSQMIAEMTSLAGTGGQGKRYNVKADGTYSRTGVDDLGGGTVGTSALPIIIRGYKTTIGDGWLGRTSNNGPLDTSNMPLVTYSNDWARWNGAKYLCFETIRFTGASTESLIDLESFSWIVGCSITNTPPGGGDTYALKLRESGLAFECDLSQAGTSGPSGGYVIRIDGQNVKIDNCRVISLQSVLGGIRVERNTMISRCLLKGAGGSSGIFADDDSYRTPFVRDCTITGWQDGIRMNNSSGNAMQAPLMVNGCMITDNSGYGIHFNNASASMGLIGKNRFRANTSGNIFNESTNNWLLAGRLYAQITTVGSDYVNAASNDYNLLSTSPGVGVNVPYYADLGPYGRVPSVGGGGSAVFNPLGQFIIRPA